MTKLLAATFGGVMVSCLSFYSISITGGYFFTFITVQMQWGCEDTLLAVLNYKLINTVGMDFDMTGTPTQVCSTVKTFLCSYFHSDVQN